MRSGIGMGILFVRIKSNTSNSILNLTRSVASSTAPPSKNKADSICMPLRRIRHCANLTFWASRFIGLPGTLIEEYCDERKFGPDLDYQASEIKSPFGSEK